MFWDSSALVPLVVPEARSRELASLLAADPAPALWWGSPVECLSAIHRQHRLGAVPESTLREALLRLDALTEDLDTVAPTEPVRQRAGRLLAVHPLRAADALQLAAALVWCREAPHQEQLVSLDARLRAAARRERFEVVPAERR